MQGAVIVHLSTLPQPVALPRFPAARSGSVLRSCRFMCVDLLIPVPRTKEQGGVGGIGGRAAWRQLLLLRSGRQAGKGGSKHYI
jgi:hypothetical protein